MRTTQTVTTNESPSSELVSVIGYARPAVRWPVWAILVETFGTMATIAAIVVFCCMLPFEIQDLVSPIGPSSLMFAGYGSAIVLICLLIFSVPLRMLVSDSLQTRGLAERSSANRILWWILAIALLSHLGNVVLCSVCS